MAQQPNGSRATKSGTSREQRLGKADYFKTGMQLLAEGGITAVTIANVCARLHVTKGSFYHHFESGPAFHAELLANYEEEYAKRRIQAVDAITDPASRLQALLERGVERDHEAESALRAWSRTDPTAAEVMQRVDAARTRYLTDFLVSQGVPEPEARVHADISLALVAGAQAMSRIVDRRKLHAMLSEHARWIGEIIARAADGNSAGGPKAPRRRRQEATTAPARTVSTA
jgi:AcrR family transcriptional regulator